MDPSSDSGGFSHSECSLPHPFPLRAPLQKQKAAKVSSNATTGKRERESPAAAVELVDSILSAKRAKKDKTPKSKLKRIEAPTAENIWGQSWENLGPEPSPGGRLDGFMFGEPSPGLNTRSSRRSGGGGSAFPSAVRSASSLRSTMGSSSSGGKAKHLGEESDPASLSTGLTPGTAGGAGNFFGSESMIPWQLLGASPGISGLLQTPSLANMEFSNFFTDTDESVRATPRTHGASPRSARSHAGGGMSPSTFLKSPAGRQAPTPSSRRGQPAPPPSTKSSAAPSMSGAKAAAAAAAARADDGDMRGSSSSPRKRPAPPPVVVEEPPVLERRGRPSPVSVGAALPPSSGPASSRSKRSARR